MYNCDKLKAFVSAVMENAGLYKHHADQFAEAYYMPKCVASALMA